MGSYSIRKFLYGMFGDLLAAVVVWLGTYLSTTPIDQWWIKAIIAGAGTVAVAKLRQKVLPGWGS